MTVIGVGKRENLVDIALLEYCVREELNQTRAPGHGGARPLKVIITIIPRARWKNSKP